MGRSRRSTSRSSSPIHRRWQVEGLEPRCLLSVSTTQFTGANPATPSTTAPASTTVDVQGYSPAQIVQAYGFDTLTTALGAQGGDGSGQTIALVEAYHDPTLAADLQVFNRQFNLPPLVSLVYQQSSTALPAADATWSHETALDVEWAHAIAPGAHLIIVEANSDQLSDLLSAVDTARNIADVSVVSMSWGVNEFADETLFDYLFTTPQGHQPITFLASSGDRQASASLQWPGTSPNVVSVGGSTLELANSTTSATETIWTGAFAGQSAYEPAGSYQTSASGARAVPDVVYNADPSPGFAVYDSSQGGWQTVGGTSAGAPQWAALIAIANQARVNQGLATLDGPTQTLPQLYAFYQQSSATHVVTLPSSNTIFVSTDSANTYSYVSLISNGTAQSAPVVQGFLSLGNASTTLSAPNQPSLQSLKKRIRDKVARPAIVFNFHVAPPPLLSATSSFSAPHAQQRSVPAISSSRSGAVESDVVLAQATSAPMAGATLLAAAFSATLSGAAPPSSSPAQSFTGLFVSAAAIFSETQVVPVGVDAPSAGHRMPPLYIARLNIAATFCDAVAAFIDDSAAPSQPLAAAQGAASVSHTRAWVITGIVTAIDVLVLHHLATRRRGKRPAQLLDRDTALALTEV